MKTLTITEDDFPLLMAISCRFSKGYSPLLKHSQVFYHWK